MQLEEKDIIYEDNHLIIVNKPAGMPVQGDESGDVSLYELVQQYIKEKYKKPGDVYLGLVHRIDRPVSGLVIFARTSKAASRLSEMFRERKIQKTYLAIVDKQPPQLEGTIRNYIWKDKDANRAYCYAREKKGSKLAVLNYQLKEEVNQFILLEVNPETGRPHQIRAQLSSINCPIVGDTKYGNKMPLNDRSICLLARRLEFIHPVKNTKMEVLAPAPYNKFWQRFNLPGR
jgi:23S rRNA pseudouridine1911/1915/1917 synthase